MSATFKVERHRQTGHVMIIRTDRGGPWAGLASPCSTPVSSLELLPSELAALSDALHKFTVAEAYRQNTKDDAVDA